MNLLNYFVTNDSSPISVIAGFVARNSGTVNSIHAREMKVNVTSMLMLLCVGEGYAKGNSSSM
jgi:hypothetical protein